MCKIYDLWINRDFTYIEETHRTLKAVRVVSVYKYAVHALIIVCFREDNVIREAGLIATQYSRTLKFIAA